MRTIIALSILALPMLAASDEASSWSPKGAASYLDQRAEWWVGWDRSQRDHGTFCISCHTALPYALGRPSLRSALGETGPSTAERQLIDNVTKRVRMWSEVLPFYNEGSGAGKSAESHTTEAVLDALILASYDPKMNADTELALKNMWALQYTSGAKKGGFLWLQFHNEPWEGDSSQYWGSTLAALAAGSTPKSYQASVHENIAMLSEYLQSEMAAQPLINRTVLLWASMKVPGLLKPEQKQAIIDELIAKQREDGGWCTAWLLPKWSRKDMTSMPSVSDGYGTGLVTFVLEQAGMSRSSASVKRGLAWLDQNQDKATGLWPATSLNKQRDPASDAGKFMSDAATAYASMALAGTK